RQRTLSEMSFQPIQVAAAVNDFVNARLKEKNREKCGDEYLQKSCRSSKHAQVLHGATVTRQDLPSPIFYRRSASTKTGTRLSASLKFSNSAIGQMCSRMSCPIKVCRSARPDPSRYPNLFR